jgi:hypothetical protein
MASAATIRIAATANVIRMPVATAPLALARASDLIASVPERHTGTQRSGMHRFPLPISTPEITVSLLWHPRQDADPAHRWLSAHVRAPAQTPTEWKNCEAEKSTASPTIGNHETISTIYAFQFSCIAALSSLIVCGGGHVGADLPD